MSGSSAGAPAAAGSAPTAGEEAPFPTCAEAKAARDAAWAVLQDHVEEDESLITHELCGGMIAEHIFLGLADDGYLRGYPTSDTMRIAHGCEARGETSISPCCVTHVDRVPVRHLALLVQHDEHVIAHIDAQIEAMEAAPKCGECGQPKFDVPF